jgi:hypothetical protein
LYFQGKSVNNKKDFKNMLSLLPSAKVLYQNN